MPTIAYDPTRAGLFSPQLRPPLAMDASWAVDAIAAEFSRLAYVRFEAGEAGRATIAGAVARIGYRDLGFFDDPRAPDQRVFDAQGFAAIDAAGRAIVAFRGTQPDALGDVLSDIDAIPRDWPGPGWVHHGFWATLDTIRSQVDAWLAARTVTHLTITGHSLGAAMATLLAGLKENADLVTFGSPRVGNAAFAASLAARSARRYVDCTDLVPTLPPALGYTHAGGLHYIDATGRVCAPGAPMPSLIADHLAANRAYLPLMTDPANAPFRGLADHAPLNYVAAVRGCRVGP